MTYKKLLDSLSFVENNFWRHLSCQISEESIRECPTLVLFSIFVVFEMEVRILVESDKKVTLHESIVKMSKENNLTREDIEVLLEFKEIRNKIIHENMTHGLIIDGVAYMLDELDTHEYILENIASKAFLILKNIVEQKQGV